MCITGGKHINCHCDTTERTLINYDSPTRHAQTQ